MLPMWMPSFDALAPGGLVVVYNVGPRPAREDETFVPAGDGRFPFDRALVERVGFEVVRFDGNDSPDARKIAGALGFGELGSADNLFAFYTILRRPDRT